MLGARLGRIFVGATRDQATPDPVEARAPAAPIPLAPVRPAPAKPMLRSGKETGRGRIIAQRPDRLGARLTSILNAMRLCKDHDLPLAIAWGTTGQAGASLSRPDLLFEEGFIDRYFLDAADWQEIFQDATPLRDLGQSGFDVNALRAGVGGGTDYHCGRAFGVSRLHGEDPEEVATRYAAMIDDLPLAPRLREILADIDLRLREAPATAAYHIRRGDIVSDPVAMNRPWPEKYVPTVYYEEHMRGEAAKGTRILVFSDSQPEIARLALRFDLLTFEDLIDGQALEPIERDCLELLTMSRCNRVIAPGSSAFSSTAAEIGGATKVDLPDGLGESRSRAASRRLINRLGRGSSDFTGPGDLAQSLNHATVFLRQRDARARAAQLIEENVAAGLNVAFLYPMLMGLRLELGEFDRAAGIWRDMIAFRIVLDDQAFGLTACQAAVAHAAIGEREEAARLITLALWHAPLDRDVGFAAALLMEAGVSPPTGSFPLDPALGQRAPLRLSPREEHPFLQALNLEVTSIPRIHSDLLARDWRELLNRRLNRAFGVKEKIAQRADRLVRLAEQARDPALLGALSVYAKALGDPDCAQNLAKAALDGGAEKALAHKRLADLAAERGETEVALTHAEAASQAAPSQPCFLADLAERQRRTGDRAGAQATLERAVATNPPIPDIHLRRAQQLRGGREHEAALDRVNAAIALAPANHRLRQEEALILRLLGRPQEALSVLERLEDWGRAFPASFKDRAAILEELGAHDDAVALAKRAVAGSPGNPQMQAFLDSLESGPGEEPAGGASTGEESTGEEPHGAQPS